MHATAAEHGKAVNLVVLTVLGQVLDQVQKSSTIS